MGAGPELLNAESPERCAALESRQCVTIHVGVLTSCRVTTVGAVRDTGFLRVGVLSSPKSVLSSFPDRERVS